jgi:anti-sigma B factor antagonist
MDKNMHHNPKDMDVVHLGGRLDCNSAPDLEEALNNLIDTLHLNLVINCEKLEFMDSTGIKVILSALQKARNMDGDIRLTCLKPEVKEVISTDEPSNIIMFFDSEDDAIKSYL